MSSTVVSTDGTVIALDDHGRRDAPVLVHVHGASTYRAVLPTTSAEIAELADVRVIGYDRRGRGESGDTAPYAVQREVEDVAALVELAGGPAWLLGESSGAVLALEAARLGVPVAGVLAYEPPFIVNAGRPPVPADYRERLDRLVADGRAEDALKLFTIEAVGLPAEMVEGITQTPYWPLVVPIAHTLSYDAQVMADTQRGDPAPLARYAEVGVPVRVLVGSETFPFMHDAATALVAVLRDGELVELPGADHQLSPATVAPAVRRALHGSDG